MSEDTAGIDVIRVRIDNLCGKIEDGFAQMQRAFEEQSAQMASLADRLHTVEIGEAGCRAVRAEYSTMRQEITTIREEIAASKAKIGFIVAGGSLAVSVAVGLAIKFLGG